MAQETCFGHPDPAYQAAIDFILKNTELRSKDDVHWNPKSRDVNGLRIIAFSWL
jgi:hypothetical protein